MTLLEMGVDELGALLKDMGQPAYRAKQLFAWLHRGAAVAEMTDLPAALREKLAELPMGGAAILKKLVSEQDGTAKYLFLLEDGNIIEGVLMKYKHGNTLCISTQVGCRMGCGFCASTLDGRVRDLTAGEMLAQVLCAAKDNPVDTGRSVTNIVLMGSGEPLDNYENVVRFLRLVTSEAGMNVSARNISLSTCGLPDEIRRLADEGIGVTLALSLHAPNDALRRTIMPIANKHPLAEVMDAVRYYVGVTGRRAIFEYALIEGVNDTQACAKELAALLRRLQCHVNLIPLNAVKERSYKGSRAAGAFLKWLTELGISATTRREMGRDIQGACGQLRQHYMDTQTMEDDSHGSRHAKQTEDDA